MTYSGTQWKCVYYEYLPHYFTVLMPMLNDAMLKLGFFFFFKRKFGCEQVCFIGEPF